MSKNGTSKHLRYSDPGPMPTAATFCRHCSESFPVAVPIIGQPGVQFLQKTSDLALHLNEKHANEIQADALAQLNCTVAYSAQRVIRHFTSNDTGLLEWCDRQRQKLLNASIRTVPDDRIEMKVSQLYELCAQRGTQPTPQEIIDLLKSMRDAIEGRGLYPGETLEPTPAPILTV